MKSAHLPGVPLSERDYELLERCFISRQVADLACLRRVSDAEGRTVVGANGRAGDFSGIIFPYISPLDSHLQEYRLRRDVPDLEEQGGKVVERAKYLSPPGARNHAYFPPGVNRDWLDDPTLPILIIEGEKKCLAMWEVAWHGLGDAAERPRFLPIGIPGVWNWKGRIGKTEAAGGGTRDVYGVIPDLQNIRLRGRTVTLLFDSNTHSNADVKRALQHLAGWLAGRDARVKLADLPAEDGVNGPDDCAGKHGAPYVLGIINQAIAFESAEPRAVLSPAEQEVVQRQPYTGFLAEYENYARARLAEVPHDYHTVTGLVLMAGLLGGKLRTDTGLSPTLAGLIVGLQGHGKSLPTVIARELIDKIEQEELVAYRAALGELKRHLRQHGEGSEEVQEQLDRLERGGRPAIIIATSASVEGLLEALSNQPNGIVDFDEFGAFLKDCDRQHMKSARENFLKVLDGRSVYYRRARGQSVDVQRPALSLWGTINLASLQAAATNEDLLGGFFSRFLFCAPDYNFAFPVLQSGDAVMAKLLDDVLRRWRKMAAAMVVFEEGALLRATEYGYAIAPYSKGEHVDITEPEDQAASIAYIRYPTFAQKVAILLAASECPTPPGTLKVTMRHMLLAISLVERLRQYAIRVLRHIEKRDPLVADAEKVLAKMRKHPGRDRSDYQRMMKWNAKKFTAAVEELESSRQVNWNDEQSTGGRTRRIYFPK